MTLIVAANGTPIFNLDEMVPVLKENAGKSIELTVNRNGQMLPVSLAVPEPRRRMRLWISGSIGGGGAQPSDAVVTGQGRGDKHFRMVGALLSPKSDVKAASLQRSLSASCACTQVLKPATAGNWRSR
jgi:hypothetical protein